VLPGSTTTTFSLSTPVAQQELDGTAALGAVADDDDVVVHLLPPPGDPELLAALRGEDLQGGADQQDQEGDPERRDHERR
jgi:hypothetical protein